MPSSHLSEHTFFFIKVSVYFFLHIFLNKHIFCDSVCMCVCVRLSVLNSQRASKQLGVPVLVRILFYKAFNKRFSPLSFTEPSAVHSSATASRGH